MISERQGSSLATRASLIERQKDCEDHASWQEFYDLYRGLIFRFALKAGCTETEADEVVQETVIGVARKLPEFRYEPERGAFKTWLLNKKLWRVKDQLRKRQTWEGRLAGGSRARAGESPALSREDTARTATVERVADSR